MTSRVPKRKNILFTNLFLATRTGSELHILELASAFINSGWDVTCFALVTAHPMIEAFSKIGIKLVELGHERELENHYTVLFAQHHLASDYIWTNTDITFDKIVVSSLGPKTQHEKLPFLSKDADLFVYVSEETRLANHIDSSTAPHLIFPNCISSCFFDSAEKTTRHFGQAPSKIAVVSNHVAPELRQLSSLLVDSCSIGYFGLEDLSIDVTPDFLQEYDLVITIGRTVSACFATRTPVYVYDIFGGGGYITPDTLVQSAKYNFSGRPSCVRKTTHELKEDIFNRYADACTYLDELYAFAKRERSFEKTFGLLLDNIESIASNPHYPRTFEPIIQIKQQLLVDNFAENYSRSLGYAQLFYPDSQGQLTEENSVLVRYAYDSAITLPLNCRDGKFVRFDPDNNPVCCKVTSELVPLNSYKKSGDGDIFVTDDPMYSIPEGLSQVDFICHKIDVWREICTEEGQSPERRLSQPIRRVINRIWNIFGK